MTLLTDPVYTLIKWLHVLLAITAVGANVTYGAWLARATRDPQHLTFALRGVKFLDDRVANPAYGLLLVTGVILWWRLPWPLQTGWLLAALFLYVLVLVLGLGVYTPLLRRQIAAAEQPGPASAEYRAIARQGMLLGIVLALLVVAITFLMVSKPF